MKRNVVLVTGGRGFSSIDMFEWAMNRWRPSHLVAGDASGADAMARDYATKMGIPLMVGVAHWKALGRVAGPTRNKAMVEMCHIDLCLAFPGGVGTANCRSLAEVSGINVIDVSEAYVGMIRIAHDSIGKDSSS